MGITFKLFDFDSHYYEATDAFTRYAEPTLGSRGVQWATINGRERLVVGGQINRYILNPTFDPVARPGALYSWYRGNPDGLDLKDAFGELEPIHPAYRDRQARLAVMDTQGVGGSLLFPTLGVGMEDALKNDPEAASKVFRAFNAWLEDDWGFAYQQRLFAVPYISFLDHHEAEAELRRVLDLGAVATDHRSIRCTTDSGVWRRRAAWWWPRMPESRVTTRW